MTLRNQHVRPFFLKSPNFDRKNRYNFREDLFFSIWRSPNFDRKNRYNFGEDLLFFGGHIIIRTKLRHFLRLFWRSQNRKSVKFELAPGPRLALGAPGLDYFIITSTRSGVLGGVEDTRLDAKAKDTKKIRGQGQPLRGQTLSRPRTGMLEAKDQGHSRKCSPKKGLQNFFSGDLQFIGVPRIFDWGKSISQITRNDVIKIFPNMKFFWDKNIVGWKI